MASDDQQPMPAKAQPGRAGAQAAAGHPEEMRGSVEFQFFDRIAMKAGGRATPAGLVAAALLITAIAIPIVLLRRAPRR